MKSVYELKLNESLSYNEKDYSLRIIKVPGGWIYTINDYTGVGCAFVPLDKEFQKPKDTASVLETMDKEVLEQLDKEVVESVLEKVDKKEIS